MQGSESCCDFVYVKASEMDTSHFMCWCHLQSPQFFLYLFIYLSLGVFINKNITKKCYFIFWSFGCRNCSCCWYYFCQKLFMFSVYESRYVWHVDNFQILCGITRRVFMWTNQMLSMVSEDVSSPYCILFCLFEAYHILKNAIYPCDTVVRHFFPIFVATF